MTERELPAGWIEVELGDITSKPQYGWTSKAGPVGKIKYLRTTDLTKGKVNWESVPFCEDEPEDVEKYQLYENDIVITRAGSVGFSFRIKEVPDNVVFASYLIRFRANLVEPKYIEYFLQTPNYWKAISEVASGIALQNINAVKLSGLKLALAPLAEQKRIVAKLDEAFQHLDTLKAKLERIPELLKTFRQTVLAQAVTGKLTEEWREDNNLLEWETKKLSGISKRITVGFVGKMSNEYVETGIPFLRSQNVRAFKYSEKGLLYVTPEFHKKISKSSLLPGDVVIVRSGYPGTTCVIPDSLLEANCSDILILTPIKELLNSHFVAIFMNSDFGRNIVFHGKVGNAQQHFNTKTLQNTEIPLPSIEEQNKIVKKVEVLFAKADAIEAYYTTLKEKIEKLPQALLAKAFRGELVPQNPNDEPASVLLEKIKATKDKNAQMGTGKIKNQTVLTF